MKLRAIAPLAGALLLAAAGGTAAADYTTQTVRVGVQHNMEATLFTPNGPGPYPSVLVLHTSGGLSEADRGYCANLARAGYICIAPAFLRAHGITNAELRRKSFTSEARPIYDDFVEIVGELNALPKARKGAVGAVGFSNGGFFAALLAATRRIKAGVSYYGALDGARTHPDLDIFRKYWTAQSSPMLVLAGRNDTTIGMGPPQKLEQIMKAAGAPYEIAYYPNTGHDFDRSGSTGSDNATSAADAWQRTLAFLGKYLQ
ncbi:MAG: dienelactone hydrolase family protein [Proteobacteria bacterium]|nr:dienelactone hydrolase family protein [Pseudomonadota bacterium]